MKWIKVNNGRFLKFEEERITELTYEIVKSISLKNGCSSTFFRVLIIVDNDRIHRLWCFSDLEIILKVLSRLQRYFSNKYPKTEIFELTKKELKNVYKEDL